MRRLRAPVRHSARLAGLAVALAVIAGCVPVDPSAAQTGGTLQGKILWCASSRPYPAAYLRVGLVASGGASSLAYTAADGFYYFHNIPAGEYLLKVYRGGSSPPLTYRVHMLGQSHTDINPICLK